MPKSRLNIDLHVHTCYSPDSLTSLDKLIDRCQLVKLSCIAITDHNTITGALAVKEKAPFQVIVGEEIRTTQGDIIGLFLSQVIPRGLTPEETVKNIKEQKGLVVIPHPFDRIRSSVLQPAALEKVLPHADLIETFNARNRFSKTDDKANEMANTLGISGCAVSDSHTLGELGTTYTRIDEFDGTPAGLLNAVKDGSLVRKRSSVLVHMASTYAKLHHRVRWLHQC